MSVLDLPLDLLALVCAFAPARDAVRLCSTCVALRRAGASRELWHAVLVARLQHAAAAAAAADADELHRRATELLERVDESLPIDRAPSASVYAAALDVGAALLDGHAHVSSLLAITAASTSVRGLRWRDKRFAQSARGMWVSMNDGSLVEMPDAADLDSKRVPLEPIKHYRSNASGAAYDALVNDSVVVLSGYYNSVSVFDRETGTTNCVIDNESASYRMDWGPDQLYLIGYSGTLRACDMTTGTTLVKKNLAKDRMWNVVLDGNVVYTTSRDGLLHRTDTRTWHSELLVRVPDSEHASMYGFAMTDSTFYASGFSQLHVIDRRKSRAPITTCALGHTSSIWDLHVDPTLGVLVTASWDRSVGAFSLLAGQPESPLGEGCRMTHHDASHYAVVVHDDYMLTAGDDGNVAVWRFGFASPLDTSRVERWTPTFRTTER